MPGGSSGDVVYKVDPAHGVHSPLPPTHRAKRNRGDQYKSFGHLVSSSNKDTILCVSIEVGKMHLNTVCRMYIVVGVSVEYEDTGYVRGVTQKVEAQAAPTSFSFPHDLQNTAFRSDPPSAPIFTATQRKCLHLKKTVHQLKKLESKSHQVVWSYSIKMMRLSNPGAIVTGNCSW